MDRKLDTSIAETRKKTDSVEARLETRATAEEVKRSKDRTEVHNETDLIRNDVTRLESKIDKEAQEITDRTQNKIMEVRQEYVEVRN
jgi:hypothetical protein